MSGDFLLAIDRSLEATIEVMANSAVITTLAECMSAMAPYAGGSVPASTDTAYSEWRRWIQLGQQDAANRGFWRRLLVKGNLTITADAETADLPDDFGKVNGIHALFVGSDPVDWNQNNNTDEQKLFVYLDPTTATWKVRFTGFTPTETTTGELWYFYNPPKPEEESDPLYLDGEMIMFYALKEYFRKARQFGSLDDARIEYENRFSELLSLEVIPSPQELASWAGYYSHRNTTERDYYAGRRSRRS